MFEERVYSPAEIQSNPRQRLLVLDFTGCRVPGLGRNYLALSLRFLCDENGFARFPRVVPEHYGLTRRKIRHY
jgi:hypothetical protein